MQKNKQTTRSTATRSTKILEKLACTKGNEDGINTPKYASLHPKKKKKEEEKKLDTTSSQINKLCSKNNMKYEHNHATYEYISCLCLL
jgi:hypothetical protein